MRPDASKYIALEISIGATKIFERLAFKDQHALDEKRE